MTCVKINVVVDGRINLKGIFFWRESFCQGAMSLKPAVFDMSDPAASCEGAAVEEENLPEWSVAGSREPNELD